MYFSLHLYTAIAIHLYKFIDKLNVFKNIVNLFIFTVANFCEIAVKRHLDLLSKVVSLIVLNNNH